MLFGPLNEPSIVLTPVNAPAGVAVKVLPRRVPSPPNCAQLTVVSEFNPPGATMSMGVPFATPTASKAPSRISNLNLDIVNFSSSSEPYALISVEFFFVSGHRFAVRVKQRDAQEFSLVRGLFENRAKRRDADAAGDEYVWLFRIAHDEVAVQIGDFNGVAAFERFETFLECAAAL